MTAGGWPSGGSGLFGWWRDGPAQARRALVAAALGWMLDAFDVTLFAMALPAVRAELGLSQTAGGVLGSVTLVAAAAAGAASSAGSPIASGARAR